VSNLIPIRTARRPPVDDAYSAWFNACCRCTHALQEWKAAARETRAAAYLRYLAELSAEEAAAAELERLHAVYAAA
jgi:hypothetical protein